MNQTKLPSLIALKAFEATARVGSMKEASLELHVTPGAISQLIKKLEDELSTKLFERKNRELCLTEEGSKLREGALGAFNMLKQTVKELPLRSAADSVSIACHAAFANNWLAPRLRKLLAIQPDVDIDVQIYRDLNELSVTACDIAITAEKPSVRNMQFMCIGNETFSVLGSPQYMKRLNKNTGNLMAGAILLNCEYIPELASPTWEDWYRECNLQVGTQHQTVSFGKNFDQALHAAREGVGLILSPNALVSDDIQSGRLICPFGPRLHTNVFYWIGTATLTTPCPIIETTKRWLVSEMETSLSLISMKSLAQSDHPVFSIENPKTAQQIQPEPLTSEAF